MGGGAWRLDADAADDDEADGAEALPLYGAAEDDDDMLLGGLRSSLLLR